MSGLRAIFCVVLLIVAAAPALAAKPYDRGSTPGLGWGAGGSKKSLGAPGPVAGVGLPAVALVGGYLWFARRRQLGEVPNRKGQ